MNINMDEAYKHERTSNIVNSNNNNKFNTPYPGSGAILIINGKLVTTKYTTQIQDGLILKDHIKFFLEKYKENSKDDCNDIYWRGLGQAHSKLTNMD